MLDCPLKINLTKSPRSLTMVLVRNRLSQVELMAPQRLSQARVLFIVMVLLACERVLGDIFLFAFISAFNYKTPTYNSGSTQHTADYDYRIRRLVIIALKR